MSTFLTKSIAWLFYNTWTVSLENRNKMVQKTAIENFRAELKRDELQSKDVFILSKINFPALKTNIPVLYRKDTGQMWKLNEGVLVPVMYEFFGSYGHTWERAVEKYLLDHPEDKK